jgi:putative sigma-54 modulation protein
MAVECTGRNIDVSPSLKAFAEERTKRLERHLGGPTRVRVVLTHEKHRYGAEIIATHRRRRWTAVEETPDLRAALAAAFEKIDTQAKKDAEKSRDRKHRTAAGSRRAASAAPEPATPEPLSGSDGHRIVRTGALPVKPMSVEEAALRIENSRQEFLVFRDSSSEKVSVLYRRRDGDFGLIVPEW